MSTLATVTGIWTEYLGTAPSGPDVDFFDAGGTSLTMVRFLAAVHDAYGVELPVDRLFGEGFTVSVTVRAIEEALVASAGDGELDAIMADLADLSDDEIRALLAENA